MKLDLEAKTKNEKSIKEYLEENASDILAFKINTGNKTLKGCWSYIVQEAKKVYESMNGKKDGGVGIENETVYGWAIHYFEENEIKETKEVVKQNKNTTPKPKKEEDEQVDGQLSLFDFNEGSDDDSEPVDED